MLMEHDPEEERLILEILTQIAQESNLSVGRVKRRLLIKRNAKTNRRFWEILDDWLPNHPFEYVGSCPGCGTLELVPSFLTEIIPDGSIYY